MLPANRVRMYGHAYRKYPEDPIAERVAKGLRLRQHQERGEGIAKGETYRTIGISTCMYFHEKAIPCMKRCSRCPSPF